MTRLLTRFRPATILLTLSTLLLPTVAAAQRAGGAVGVVHPLSDVHGGGVKKPALH